MLKTTTFLLFVGDIAAFVGGLFIALMLRYQQLPEQEVVSEHLSAFFWVFILWAVVFLIAGLYDTKVNFSRKLIPGIVMRAQTVNLALAVLVFFIFPVGITPKITLAIYLVVTTVLVVWWRLFVFPLLIVKRTERALIVGSGDEARGLARILNEGRFFKFVVAEVVDPHEYQDVAALEQALRTYIAQHTVSMIIGDMHSERAPALVPVFYELAIAHQGVAFLSLHALYEDIFHRIPPSLVRESWVLENISLVPHTFDDVLKRSFDIIVAVILGAVSLPLFPLIMFAIKSEDGGTAFYQTERVGRYGKSIYIRKFRTKNGHDAGTAALNSTLRTTRVGAFLRKTRLDELPQIWNVLRGDLSFIGPRPEMPALAQVYTEQIPHYAMRHLIKPGLSGWAQINDFDAPRNGVDIERTISKLSFDLYYLKRRSFFLDLEIALKTIKALLLRSGT
jgi:exopolysaccharide biosynthesis polyprenyl glycosylphosphotransferase